MVGSPVRSVASAATPSAASIAAIRSPKRSVLSRPAKATGRPRRPSARAVVKGPPPGYGESVPSVRRNEIDQCLPRDQDPVLRAHVAHRTRRRSVRRVSPHPRAGRLPEPGDLVDVDALLEAYRHPPREPVAFGTSGHRGTSLDGSFTEAHVVAISAAVCEYRAQAGDRRPALPRPRHARPLHPGLRHDRRRPLRAAASTWSWTATAARRRRRSSPTRSSPTTGSRTGSSSPPRTTRPATAASSTTRRTAARPTPT